ncbi:MAG: hypothetical protein ACKOJF_34095, partial [Planctomycetaceae bacterium]
MLVATGVISRDTPIAREVVTSSKNGFPWQASVGAAVEEFEFIRESQSVTVNGRAWPGPVNVVRRSTLGEISFVDLGADGATTASVLATSLAGVFPGQGDATGASPASVSGLAANPPIAAQEPSLPRDHGAASSQLSGEFEWANAPSPVPTRVAEAVGTLPPGQVTA